MAEFSIIDKYCKSVGKAQAETVLSVGDDAAIIRIPTGYDLAISVDTMVEGVHFFKGTSPSKLAHKLFAVNLSDMAAMGADPKWITIALTLPQHLTTQNNAWIADFTETINQLGQQYKVQLIGGDMTQGSLTMTMQIKGLLPQGKGLTRSKAVVDDDVYVSNTVGDAALYLQSKLNDLEFSDSELLAHAFHKPSPRIELGLALLDCANSCVDVSDGLVADLAHIAALSEVSIELNVEDIPVSKKFQEYIQKGGSIDLALTGGDDYELVFTAPQSARVALQKISEKTETLTRIGMVIEQKHEPVLLKKQGNTYELTSNFGYEHFK